MGIKINADTFLRSVGPNIFPALQSVTGEVVIEAWNGDFDCSKLVQYQQDHTIHYLSCNGLNNGTNNGTNNGAGGSSHTTNQVLSPGAWAGIGVAIGVFALGLVGGIIWLYIHFKHQLRSSAQTSPETTRRKETTEDHAELPRIVPTPEVDGVGIRREKPDDLMVELPVRPAELPTSP